MNRILKKTAAVVVAAMLTAGSMPSWFGFQKPLSDLAITANAATLESGKCGPSAVWTLDTSGELSIVGTGKLFEYSYDKAPWYDFRSLIKSVEIESGVTSIGKRTFQDCSMLTSVTIPESVTSIGELVFNNCSLLSSVTLPESLTAISKEMFSNCTSLTSVTIPEGVTSIGDFAFSHCTSLSSVTIPESVTSIGGYAFYNCRACTDVY
ncbi:MAG: leucine-rich repeat domain-containing protein, partial [Ruminococcus sp.]|nr:leucine-rich repeat domain-containing protein [Ruminococcus sp.]